MKKNKEFLEINLNQFGIWKNLQMIYLPFIFNFMLFIEFWVKLIGPRLILLLILTVWPSLFSLFFRRVRPR
jgi:hypothetical protein